MPASRMSFAYISTLIQDQQISQSKTPAKKEICEQSQELI